MQLYEFQAKSIFQHYGIPIPQGHLAKTVTAAVQAAKRLGRPVVVKAQVLVDGRGLAGGIKFCDRPKMVREAAVQLLRTDIKGARPVALLIEERLRPVQELYAGITWDYTHKCPVVIASSLGGVSIELTAKQHPDLVVRRRADPFSAYQGRELATEIGLRGNQVIEYAKIMTALWGIFEKHDAELVEVNPIGVLRNRKLVALDAKMNVDDKSLFRQDRLLGLIRKVPTGGSTELERRRARAKRMGIPTYIEMEGDIGVISDGAGSGMLTLDLIVDSGGKPRVYCEMGGEATRELISNAMRATLAVSGLRVVFVTLIGGLNRMDEMAEGIVAYLRTHSTKVPFIVRMSGTLEKEGRDTLIANGIQAFDNLYEAVDAALSFGKRTDWRS